MKNLFFIVFLWIPMSLYAQHTLQGKVLDAQTKEPLIGATVAVVGSSNGSSTNANGAFRLQITDSTTRLEISYVGYDKQVVAVDNGKLLVIALQPTVNNLQQVVVTANRETSLRTDAPMAISKLSSTMISESKPTLIAELINKVPGVVMVNYNNEQHAMAIRQPMGTSPYFLYLEDGIPVRPMGVFNHNALIEMNVFAVSTVEVVKGPTSSLYGPEAVGGAINFITHRPTAVPTARIGIQADQWGYQRLQYGGGAMITKKVGFFIGGFVAKQRDSWQTYSDYDKFSLNARLEYAFSDKTRLTAAFSDNEYTSDMSGSVDSVAFYNRQYSSTTDFCYRKVHSQRSRLTLEHQWNANQETSVSVFYRDNYIGQNPNYGIRWKQGNPTATGEINRNSFYSWGAIAQHSIKFNFLHAKLVAGASYDYSPTKYWAYQIDLAAQLRPDKKSVEKYTLLRERQDRYLSNYDATLNNSAFYTQFEFNPVAKLKLVLGMRYDQMSFDYANYLDQASGNKSYGQVTPKIGATYNLGNGTGFYGNYSRGFSPPALTSVFRKRPNSDPAAPAEFYYNLQPALFTNYEIGGWAALLGNKIYFDWAVYQMNGQKELLSIRQPDNSSDYQSAGKTLHRGVEYGITFKPTSEWFFRFGGTNALHRFVEFTLSTRESDQLKNVDGYDMPSSPRWIANTELTYKPNYLKGLRVSLEWQRLSSWYQDQISRVKYEDRGAFGLKGISYLNFRAGYTWKGIEVYTNLMNLTDELYAHSATRGNNTTDRTTFTPAAPRTFVMGIQYSFSGKK